MRIGLPENLIAYSRVFATAGVRGYVVGGLVRNAILGYPASDIDICSALTPQEAAELFEEAGAHVVMKAPQFGTIEIHYQDLIVEHTTFRGESYPEGGEHKPSDVWFSKQLFDDAFRRDFSVNALYAELETGEIIDPTGGMADIQNRILRTTSENPDDILSSDALRVLRLCRQGAELGLRVEENTLRAARENAEKLKDIAAERKRDELTKLLLSDVKYGRGPIAVLEGLHLMDETRALDVLIPELTLGRGMEQRPDMHRYDVLEHSLRTGAAAPPELVMRLSGLLHDVGKPKVHLETGRYLGHDRAGEPIARRVLEELKYPTHLVNEVCQIVRWHMYDIQGTAKESTLRTKFGEWGRELVKRLIVMRETDIHGTGTDDEYVAERWRALYLDMERRNTPFSVTELAITGEDVMAITGLMPSPRVGQVLDELWRRCLIKPEENTRERLSRILENWARDTGLRGR